MISITNFFIISDGLILVLVFFLPLTMAIHTEHWHGFVIGLSLVLVFLLPLTMTIHAEHWHGLIVLIRTNVGAMEDSGWEGLGVCN